MSAFTIFSLSMDDIRIVICDDEIPEGHLSQAQISIQAILH